MDSERWRRAREIFRAALECELSERDAFLNRTCTDDFALRQEVRDLLLAHDEADDFLEEPAVDSRTGRIESRPSDPLEGRRIGSYRLMRCLGRGGMGSVYLGIRDDDEFQKRVAVKVLTPGMDSSEIAKRLRTERQILAALDHANIAKLLDGGTTADGLPYFVMEYVEGLPIDTYCKSNGLSTRERLELFCEVCSAVQYAHRNLVVHRDLKPSNILVTSDGTPKLLDFGIAKLLNPELSRSALAPTMTVVRLMTPDYASPEQARGEPITTTTDVYSLGVLLYYLLTRHRPYRVESSSPVEMLRVICEEEPQIPSVIVLREDAASARVRPPAVPSGVANVTPTSPSKTRDGSSVKLHRSLSGDLDNIVLKAMRKEPARRYGSVERLADDIHRHLDGLPVLARKDTWNYRLGKFVRRHRIAVAAAVVFVTACLAFGAMMAFQRAEIARERDRAEQVKAFLVELFQSADPLNASAEPPSLRGLLDDGALRLEKELSNQPEIRADLAETIGVIYQRLGEFDRALPLLEEAHEIHRDLFGERSSRAATSLNNLAKLRMDRGEFSSAQALFEQALEIRRQRLGNHHVDVAESLNELGKTFHGQGKLEVAKSYYQEALKMRRDLLGPRHIAIAESINNLGAVLFYLGDRATAEELHRETLAMRESLFDKEHVEVSESLNNLSVVLRERRAFEEARALSARALELRRKHLGDEHPRVATSHRNLAAILQEQGELKAAQEHYRQAIEIYRKKLSDRHPYLAGSLGGLASVLEQEGELDEAAELYTETIDIFRETESDQARLGIAITGLAAVRESQGEFTAADSLVHESLGILESVFPADHWRIAEAESVLAGILIGVERFSDAEPLLLRSYSILAPIPGQIAGIRKRQALLHLVELYEAVGRSGEAQSYRAML